MNSSITNPQFGQIPQGQIHFTGESSCEEFVPNQFRRNFCVTCQGKIQQHFTAKPEQIAAALEYSGDKGRNLIFYKFKKVIQNTSHARIFINHMIISSANILIKHCSSIQGMVKKR